VHRPELDAQLVAESIALQLEKRVAFRRAMRKAVDSALASAVRHQGACGGPVERRGIARKEWYLQGRLPPANTARRHRLLVPRKHKRRTA